MIRHAVLLTLSSGPDSETTRTILEALRELPRQISSIREYEVGNATIAVMARFDNEAGYIEYRDHPAHRAVIDKLISPVRQGRSAIQFLLV
jgi:stress responsive alpha/beta barrel protein